MNKNWPKKPGGVNRIDLGNVFADIPTEFKFVGIDANNFIHVFKNQPRMKEITEDGDKFYVWNGDSKTRIGLAVWDWDKLTKGKEFEEISELMGVTDDSEGTLFKLDGDLNLKSKLEKTGHFTIYSVLFNDLRKLNP